MHSSQSRESLKLEEREKIKYESYLAQSIIMQNLNHKAHEPVPK